MSVSDHANRLAQLIEKSVQNRYILFDNVAELLPEGFAGGRELDDLLLAIESTGVDVLDEPKADFEERFRSFDNLDAVKREMVDDPSEVYIREACNVPRLSRDRELEFAKQMQSDGPEAKIAERDLVEASLRMVVSIAQRRSNSGVHVLDLIQEGNQGLLDALAHFDCRRGYRYSSYAIWWVRRRIQQAIPAKLSPSP